MRMLVAHQEDADQTKDVHSSVERRLVVFIDLLDDVLGLDVGYP